MYIRIGTDKRGGLEIEIKADATMGEYFYLADILKALAGLKPNEVPSSLLGGTWQLVKEEEAL